MTSKIHLQEVVPLVLEHVRSRRFTVEEFDRLLASDVLGRDERVELIDGQIVPLSMPDERHVLVNILANDVLTEAFRGTHYVSCQNPAQVSRYDRPQPDFTIFRRSAIVSPSDIPEKAVLLIEVSNTSLSYDRHEKASLYASSGVPEYWIVNLVDTLVEVYRDPVPDASKPFGWTWSGMVSVPMGGYLQPLARPDLSLLVDRLFQP